MSKLLKSKILLGVMIVAVMVVAGAMFASSASADCSISMTLKQGMSGSEVLCLQEKLGVTQMTGYFGTITKAAVMAYQANHSLVADGIVGPLTRATLGTQVIVTPDLCPNGMTLASNCTLLPGGTPPPAETLCPNGMTLASNCTTAPGGGTPPGPLTGGAGSANYTLSSSYSSEIVGEDEADVKVAGLDIEADGSDLSLTAVRLVFNEGTAGSDFEDYATGVSVWLDGTKIGSVDSSEFTDANAWTSTITLSSGVIQENETGKLVVAVSGAGNLDTNDAGDTWTVDFRSVRFIDGLGDSTSEDPSTATKTFSFESFATSSDTELKLKLTDDAAGDAINLAHLINDHATDENQLKNIPILEFTMKADGGSDLEIRDFAAEIVVAVDDNVDDVIAGGAAPEIFFEIGGTRYGTAAYYTDADGVDVDTTELVQFTDVDYTIPAGSTVTAQIVANLTAADVHTAASTILARITEAAVTDVTALFDVRDESGTQIVDADITGTPTGIASTLRDTGFNLHFLSGTASRSHTGDVANTLDHDEGTFVLEFSVEAWDDNATSIFIDEDAPHETGATTASQVTVTGTDVYVSSSLTRTGGDAAAHTSDDFEVLAGDTVEFTITFVTAAGADGLFDITLENLLYAVATGDGDLTVGDAQIELTNDFITTPPLSLNFDAA